MLERVVSMHTNTVPMKRPFGLQAGTFGASRRLREQNLCPSGFLMDGFAWSLMLLVHLCALGRLAQRVFAANQSSMAQVNEAAIFTLEKAVAPN